MVNDPSVISITFGYLGLPAALGLFLSPIPTCRKICSKKSSEQFSALPYLAQFVESSWWACWAVAAGDRMEMLLNNVAGASIMGIYVVIFLLLPSNEHRVKIYSQSAVAFLLVGVAATIAVFVENPDTLFGVSAATLNILKYASPLSVARRVIATRSVEYLPLPLTLASLACGICWGAHGLALMDFYILVPNIIGILSSLMQIGLHLQYGGHCGSKMMTAQQQKGSSPEDTSNQDIECMVKVLMQKIEAIPGEDSIWQDASKAEALSKCKADLSDFVNSFKSHKTCDPDDSPQPLEV